MAIPTRYKGYHFRSRLEARWAVFFDFLGDPWEYEHEGYETPYGAYLPDFLVAGRALIEVKPANTDLAGSWQRWMDVVKQTRLPLVIVEGPPECGREYLTIDKHVQSIGSVVLGTCVGCDRLVFGCHEGAGDDLRISRVVDRKIETCPADCGNDKWIPISETLAGAVNASRSARFEYGESGAT
jgi:hypothetical protein